MEYLLDWEEYNTGIVCAASNGKEALELIHVHKPDIMITDIRMPIMDGLELMKEINKQQLALRVIILSGYDEFTYVREAMKYGAENYLMKPVDKEELSNSVKQIVESLDSNRYSERNKRESIQILKSNTLSRMVRNDISIKEFAEKAEFLHIDLNFDLMQVAVIELGFTHSSTEQQIENLWRKFASLNICEEIVLTKSNGIVFTDPSDNIVIIFREQGSVSNMEAAIREILAECMREISKIIRIHSFSTVGSAVTSHRELGLSYRQAISSMDYKLVIGLNKTAFYTDSYEHESINPQSRSIDVELLKDLIRTRNNTESMKYIHQLFETHQEDQITPGQIRDMMIEIVIILLNVTREFRSDALQIIDVNDFTLKLHSAKNLSDLLSEIDKITNDSIHHIQLTMDKKYSKIVSDAIEYVKENYVSPDISLKTLSAYLDVNTAYLGRTFKEETGEFFSDFLTKLRIDKAKHYLTTTQLKINEISNLVGFLNSTYFYTIFKKYTGINPGNFRQV